MKHLSKKSFSAHFFRLTEIFDFFVPGGQATSETINTMSQQVHGGPLSKRTKPAGYLVKKVPRHENEFSRRFLLLFDN